MKDNFLCNFLKNKWTLFSVCWFLGVIVLCFIGPFVCEHDYHSQNLILSAKAPSLNHIFGTDVMGRDLFARVLYGGRVSIAIGLAGTFVSLIIGIIYGSISGYLGGLIDGIMMRIVDVLYPLPFTLLVILLMAFFGRNVFLLFFAIGCVKWLTMARIVRSQIICIKDRGFVSCAMCLGQSHAGIWIKHLLPNLLGTVVVYATLTIPNVILEEAFISFLGLGIQPPLSSWGLLIFDGAKHMEEFPWLLIFPCIFFAITLFSLNILGDSLRDSLDPTK